MGFNRLESDLDKTRADVNQLTFDNVIQNSNRNNLDDILLDQNELNNLITEEPYNPQLGKPIKDLNIKLGSDQIPRYQCANHKLDLSNKKSISMHKELTNMMVIINKSNKHFRRVCKFSQIFRNKKCRLRTQGKQRWSLVYLILESVKRAYDKGCFDAEDNEKKCPVSYEKVETYLQILKPLYLLNIAFQSKHSTIADVIPGNIKPYKAIRINSYLTNQFYY